jgi:iron complex outermembrane receptor protein
MWGANAVNGVINIITKKAKDTVGSQLVAIGGRLERGGSARFGAEHGEKFQYNLFFYDLRRPSLVSSVGNVGGNADDAGTSIRGGGRADWQASKRDWVSVNGDMYRNREDQRVYQINAPSPQTEVIVEGKVQGSGGYGLMRWEHRADVSDFAIQVYYNDQNRAESKGMGREGTTDVDFQAHVPAGSRNDVTWGLGFRYNGDHIHGTPLPFFHSTHEINLFSSFVQDELSMVPDKLILTVGSKLQWNSYTHLEVQPSGRLLWTPDARHSVWTSVARAVKTPSIRERDLFTTFPEPTSLPFPTEILISGNPAIRSEVALSYEGGYRQQFAKRLSVDLAGFATHYSRLVASRPQQPYVSLSSGPMLIVPILYSNGMKANAQGLEASVSWSPVATVHFASSYAWMQARIAQSESLSTFGADTLGLNWSTPRNTINVRGAWNVTGHWTVNASVDSVSTTPIYDAGSSLPPQPVPAYRRVDLGVAYVLREHAIFRAGVHNLQSAQHIEFNPQDNYDVPSEVPRSAFAKIVWSF